MLDPKKERKVGDRFTISFTDGRESELATLVYIDESDPVLPFGLLRDKSILQLKMWFKPNGECCIGDVAELHELSESK